MDADAISGALPIAGAVEDLKEAPDEGRHLDAVERAGRLFVRWVVPVRDAAGPKLGGLFVLRDRMARDVWRSGVLLLLVALAQLVALAAPVEVFVLRRLGRMRQTLEDLSTRLGGGNYSIGESLRVESQDEIGRFEKFLGEFLATLGQTMAELEKRMGRGLPEVPRSETR